MSPIPVTGNCPACCDLMIDGLPVSDLNPVPVSLATNIQGEDETNYLLGVQSKPVASATYSALAFAAFATDVDISVKATPGNLKSVQASNSNADVRYLQIFDKASAPVNPDVPIFSFPIPAGTATVPTSRDIGTEFLGEGGSFFATGIAVGISTTVGTFTAATAGDHVVNGTYV